MGRRYQFGLRALLLFVGACSVGLSIWYWLLRPADIVGEVIVDGNPLPSGCIVFVSQPKEYGWHFRSTGIREGRFAMHLPAGSYRVAVFPMSEPVNPLKLDKYPVIHVTGGDNTCDFCFRGTRLVSAKASRGKAVMPSANNAWPQNPASMPGRAWCWQPRSSRLNRR